MLGRWILAICEHDKRMGNGHLGCQKVGRSTWKKNLDIYCKRIQFKNYDKTQKCTKGQGQHGQLLKDSFHKSNEKNVVS